LNILIVTNHFWPENFRINDLAASLKKRGHNITVLTNIPNYPQGKFYKGYGFFTKSTEYYENIKIYRFPLIPRGKGKNINLILNYISFAFFATLLAPFRIKEKIDIIFVYETSPVTIGIPAIIMKKIKKAPIYFWVQDLWPESVFAASTVKSGFVYQILNKITQSIYSYCDKILVQSKAFIPSIQEKNVSYEKIFYLPNWAEDLFELETKNKTSIFKEKNLIPKGFIVMFAGNIGESQNFPEIINAAEILKKNKDIHWVILGDGRKRSWVEEEIKKRNLEDNFHLLGRYPLELMPKFFKKADALLVALKKEYIFSLTIPGKIQSYLKSGIPIVTMLDGEGSRIIKEANAGLTAKASDSKKLSNNIIKLYNMNSKERKEMGKNGKIYYNNNFEKENLLNKLNNLFLSKSLTGIESI